MSELSVPKNHITDTFLNSIPSHPGVYIMKGADGVVLYVGKSNNLRARVKSYFKGSKDSRISIKFIQRNVTNIEFFLTDTEKEALILENNLIKKLIPRYNICLKDDKNFFKIRINIKEDYPRLELVRKQKNDGALYFGPYSSSRNIKESIRYIQMIYPLRLCKDSMFKSRTRPCLYFQIRRCLGPCCENVPKDMYRDMIKEVIMFLEGKKGELVSELMQRMEHASENMEYELAGLLRDRVFAIKQSLERQDMVSKARLNKDVFGTCYHEKWLSINALQVREGRLDSSDNFVFKHNGLPENEVLASFLQQFYQIRNIPDIIITSSAPAGIDALSQWLREKKNGKVVFASNAKGENHRVLAMAVKSARQNLISKKERSIDIELLKGKFHLLNLPKRIECYDISNTQGESPVGSCVVFVDCMPQKNLYRRYKIKSVSGQNDFAMLSEVIERRLKRAVEEQSCPDLCVIDGGKGQLSSVYSCYLRYKDKLPHIDFISLAKENESTGEGERVFVAVHKNAVPLRDGSEEKKILDRIRDEAHRFAVSYHRKLRSKSRLSSQILSIPNIGGFREKALIGHFGSVRRLKSATLEQIALVKGIGKKTAAEIYRFFHPDII